jgi:hypothetical protein
MSSATQTPIPTKASSREGSPEPRQRKFHNGWTKEQEDLMADWADIAMCYRWLHNKGEGMYKTKNYGMSVPVVLLSTITGSSSLALDTYFGNDQEMKRYANIAIGALSLVAGLLQTLGNLFRFAQLSEAHRVASIAWGKFQRQIAVELRIHPNERIDSMDFLKICRTELDRLIEQSPPIPETALKEFDTQFGKIKDITKPDICNNLERTAVFEDSESRLKKVAAEAALMLHHKKNLLKEMAMPEFERTVERKVARERERMEADLERKLETRVAERIEEIKLAVPPAPANPVDALATQYRGRPRFDFGDGATAPATPGPGIELTTRRGSTLSPTRQFLGVSASSRLNVIVDPLASAPGIQPASKI